MERRALWISVAISVAIHLSGFMYLTMRDPGSTEDPPPDSDPQWVDIDWIDSSATSERHAAGTGEASAAAERMVPERTPQRAPEIRGDDARQASPRQPRRPASLAMRVRTAKESPAGVDSGLVARDSTGPSVSIPSPADAARAVVETPGPPPSPALRVPLAPPAMGLLRGLDKGPSVPRSELRSAGGGTFRADDTAFAARVGRDGKVTVEDEPNFHARLNVPRTRDEIGRAVDDWYDESYDDKRARDLAPLVRGGFDLTDWAARLAGQDPYDHRKKQLMDRTRDERAGLARTERSRAMKESLGALPRHLAAIWSNGTLTAKARRRQLFQLWDECAETGTAEIIEAGSEARAHIIAFIQRELPRGSAWAFSYQEIDALNRQRQSRQAFAPYR